MRTICILCGSTESALPMLWDDEARAIYGDTGFCLRCSQLPQDIREALIYSAEVQALVAFIIERARLLDKDITRQDALEIIARLPEHNRPKGF
jgi:hypothetical protein